MHTRPVSDVLFTTDRYFHLPGRVLLRRITVFVYICSVWTDRSSFISTTTCASNKFSGRIHLHCWHHLLTLSLGHTLLMVEYPELALFRIHAFDPVGCCKLHFSSPDRFFFQTDRVHTCAQKALDCFF